MPSQTSASGVAPQLTVLSAQEVAWRAFRAAVVDLAKAEFGEAGLPVFYRAVAAYWTLRDHHVNRRRRRRVPKGVHDATLQRWCEETGAFRREFWRSTKPEVSRVMLAYQQLWNQWWPHTPAGKRSKAKTNTKQAKRPEVKAAKAAYLKTEAGKAARKRSRKLSQARARVAKGEAEQALYDSWRLEDELEAAAEALADV